VKSGSHLERVLRSGQFAVTSEVAPPKSASAKGIRKAAGDLRECIDALNLTDNQSAVVRLSSVAACLHVLQEGVEPVLHVTCRDRNRIGLQSDLLGAWSLGIKNILALTGDKPEIGNHPDAMGVFDLDSAGLCKVASDMRDNARFMNGEELKYGPHFFVGVGENPFAGTGEARVARLQRKIACGADFVQTQPIFDVAEFSRWVSLIGDAGLLDHVFLLGGVSPIKSYEALVRFSKVPGVVIPEDVMRRFAAVPPADQAGEGIRMAVETARALREIEGVNGVHIMAVNWHEVVPEIVDQAGLLPRIEVTAATATGH
jgi:methylenetetrahydrofolate reductase (NADPH)